MMASPNCVTSGAGPMRLGTAGTWTPQSIWLMQARSAVAGVSVDWLPDGADMLSEQAFGVAATAGHTKGAVSCPNWTTRTVMAAKRPNMDAKLPEYHSSTQAW